MMTEHEDMRERHGVSEIYRVGADVPLDIYRRDKRIAIAFDEADAAMIVQILNRSSIDVSPQTAEEPEKFRDGSGYRWTRREDGLYYLSHGGAGWTLAKIKETYGTWEEPEKVEEPERFRDGDGHWWDRQPDRRYYVLEAEGATKRTLDWVKETYGTWKEKADGNAA